MDVSSVSQVGQSSSRFQIQAGLSKGALEQTEKVVMTLLESTQASAPTAEKGRQLNVVA